MLKYIVVTYNFMNLENRIVSCLPLRKGTRLLIKGKSVLTRMFLVR